MNGARRHSVGAGCSMAGGVARRRRGRLRRSLRAAPPPEPRTRARRRRLTLKNLHTPEVLDVEYFGAAIIRAGCARRRSRCCCAITAPANSTRSTRADGLPVRCRAGMPASIPCSA